jgi:hypothetical protein
MDCIPVIQRIQHKDDEHLNAFAEILGRASNARASMSSTLAADPIHVISSVLAFDVEITTWFESLPLNYAYNTVFVSKRMPEVYHNYYHVYKNDKITGLLNLYRAVRAYNNTVIFKNLMVVCESISTEPTAFEESMQVQCQQSHDLLLELAAELCASVPCQLGVASPSRERPLTQQAWGGVMLLWPLSVVARIPIIPQELRLWIFGRFEHIGHDLGVHQSLVVLGMVKDAISLDEDNNNVR